MLSKRVLPASLLLVALAVGVACSSGSKGAALGLRASAGGSVARGVHEPGGGPGAPDAGRTDGRPDRPKARASIVRVQTEGAQLDIFGRSTPAGGVGTGVIYDNDGHIVTNNHVVMVGIASQTASPSRSRTSAPPARRSLVAMHRPTSPSSKSTSRISHRPHSGTPTRFRSARTSSRLVSRSI